MPQAIDVVANLQGLGVAARGHAPPPSEIAEAFGWSADQLKPRRITWRGEALSVERAYLGVQPAVLFASAEERHASSALDSAALFGYHAAVRWGVVADERGLTAFNSHWLQQDRWFSVPLGSWTELEGQRSFLEALGPQQVANGLPDRLALSRSIQPTLLQPVDDELVERLDAWRDEALKGSRVNSGVDEQLQVLFAKLFVLRTIEDRDLAPAVPPLQSAVTADGLVSTEALWEILAAARKFIGSELFDELELNAIPNHVIAGIVSDLYVPRRLPVQNARYNFSWIDADVLGLAYEKYLSTILHPKAPPPQQDLFQPTYRDVERISVRKAGGVYYTPQYLTRYLAKKTIDEYYKDDSAKSPPKIIDFACGSGSFLVAAVDVLLQHLKKQDPTADWARVLIEGGCINGVDVDNKAVTVARLNIWNRLAEEPNPLPLPNLSKVIVQGDGLDRKSWGDLDRSYDIVLGNPPFLATSFVNDRSGLEGRFQTARGRYDYSYLFVEQAINVTVPDGLFGMVVPNRLFRNANGAGIRNLITTSMNVISIVDFGSIEVFRGTAAYVGCVVASHMRLMAPAREALQVIEVNSMPEQFVAAFLIDAENGALLPEIRVYKAQHPRGPSPWVLLSPDEKKTQIKLSEASVVLSEIAGIYQGIRTGANELFLFDVLGEDRGVGTQVVNGLGDTAVVESALLRPVIFGAEVRKYQSVSTQKVILYPYQEGVAVSEAELGAKYPLTYRYLNSYRDMLASRSSIIASGLRWYELVRRRDEEWLNRPKLLIRDLAPETAFAVDEIGGVFSVGGTAVIPEQEEALWPLLAYLNSRPVDHLVRRTTPQFRGSFQKFEPQHLQKIPVVKRVIEEEAVWLELGDYARRITASVGLQKIEEARSLMASVDSIVAEIMRSVGVDPGT